MEKEEEYPQHVIEGIKRALQEANEGKLYLFTSVEDMLKHGKEKAKEKHNGEDEVKSKPYFRRNK